MNNRAGHFVQQPTGYKSFVPAPLPPDPDVQYDKELLKLLSDADRKLGRLDGITQILPNPELFVAMYVKKEAVLSSQIEGTQASLVDVLDIGTEKGLEGDITDVVNYVNAMEYGLKRLDQFPLSLRLIREIHSQLLCSGRGSERNPGEFRTSQNWIGPQGSTPQTAAFVPPTVPDMKIALSDWEKFMYKEDDTPSLVKIALLHAQFETIHPFLDGNGRIGRLLITFWLCHEKILSEPLLYLSYYFKKHRAEYYDRLMEIRVHGDWERWIKFFLKGISEVSDEATQSAKEIINLKEHCTSLLSGSSSAHLSLLDYLFESPVISKSDLPDKLGVSYPTISSIVDHFNELGILIDTTPDKTRNKRFVFGKYIAILNRGTEI